jgi:hypothetical protein
MLTDSLVNRNLPAATEILLAQQKNANPLEKSSFAVYRGGEIPNRAAKGGEAGRNVG